MSMLGRVPFNFRARLKQANKTASSPYYGLIASVLGLSCALRLVSVDQLNSDLEEEMVQLRRFKEQVMGIHADITKGDGKDKEEVDRLLAQLDGYSLEIREKVTRGKTEERKSKFYQQAQESGILSRREEADKEHEVVKPAKGGGSNSFMV